MPQGSDPPATPFPVLRIDLIEIKPAEALWLIEPLWGATAVGILGGQSRAGKTWLACELAVAVATGTPALGRFPTRTQGPVLFFAAEDEPPDLRARIEGIAIVRGVPFTGLPVFLLNIGQLRLDSDEDVARLRATIIELDPRLVILDPFVRLVGIDENSATEVSAVLASLRAIQRDLGCSVLLTHHLRKAPSSHLGQQLRGSGDFAAWSSSMLFITRRDDRRLLHVEHRNAPMPPPVLLCFKAEPRPHLCVVDAPTADSGLLDKAILDLLASGRPHTTVDLRDTLKIRKATLIETLSKLRAQDLVVRTPTGWRLAHDSTHLELSEQGEEST